MPRARPADPARVTSRKLPPLLPAPRSIELHGGRFGFAARQPLLLVGAASDRDHETANILRDAIEARHGFRVPLESRRSAARDETAIVLAHHGIPAGVERDRHQIDITRTQLRVEAGGSAGLRYAVETLVQLIGAGQRLPRLTIDDEPDFATRGIMIDVSRCKVPKPQTLHQLVDLCVALKLNTLMLYTEHTFRFRRHPEIGADASPLDAETMRELDRYAAQNFVDLVPCLQSLGHMDHILELPAYRELAESELGWTIDPTNPRALELLADLYDEYLPNFRSGFFNANCDEPWDLGQGRSKARSDELGPGGLYLEHIGRLRKLAAAHDKRLMIWGDVVHAHPERIPEIPDDLILLDWWYEAKFDYERVEIFRDHGLNFMVCPGTSSWNSLFPRIENSIHNIARWADAGRRYGALGMINTDWGDFGHYNLQGNSFFAFAWGAQQSWSGEMAPRSFDRAFSLRVFGDASGEAARLYRELGAIHDPGFQVFNGSALQYLFFDDIAESTFVCATKKSALERSERALKRTLARIEEARECFEREELAWHELRYAARASLFAVRKTLAARRYNDWRKRPDSLKARERKRLAKTLGGLAEQQRDLGKELRRLWMARNARSNFGRNAKRLRRSTKSLRDAARQLIANRPAPPAPDEKLTAKRVIDAVRRSFG